MSQHNPDGDLAVLFCIDGVADSYVNNWLVGSVIFDKRA